MKNLNNLIYKGFTVEFEIDYEIRKLIGTLKNTEDIVVFECDYDNRENKFHEAVDNYLCFCDKMEKDFINEFI